MNITKLVTLLRYAYHLNAIDINNVLNQLKVRKDNKADDVAKKHLETIIVDILPRLGYDTSKLYKKGES